MKKIVLGMAIFLLVLGSGALFAQNTEQKTYQLLILDRTYSALNSEIGAMNNVETMYKFNHGANGYVIVLYVSTQGPVFPPSPDKSVGLVNLVTTNRSTVREFVDSEAFNRFVTRQSIKTGIKEALVR